jgi:choline kinase
MLIHQIKTAVLLAAGSGRRLSPFTDQTPKCLVEIDGRSLLSRIVESVEASGFERLVIVTGYEAGQITNHMSQLDTRLDVMYVHNERFASTNNMYSLWLIQPHVQDGFVLVESDLIFDSEALMPFRTPNRIALDVYSPEIHNGTTATVDSEGRVNRMFVSEPHPSGIAPIYKTVNITSFCEQTRDKLFQFLDHNIRVGNTGGYYELGIKSLIESGESSFDIVDFSALWWDEIDTMTDWIRVERMLATNQPRQEMAT